MQSLSLSPRRAVLLLPVLISAALPGCKAPDDGASNGANTSGGNAANTSSNTTSSNPTDTGSVAVAPPYKGDDILIGEYGSLSGTAATFGTSSRDGIALAVEQQNAKGGVLGKKIRVQLEDDAGQPQQATTVVKKLINQYNVLAVLGEVASTRSIAGGKVCQASKVPMISPTSTNPKVTQVGDYIFRTCFIDPFQGSINARFARENLKAKTAAVLTDIKNDYSVGLSDIFVKSFKEQGGTIVGRESYKEGDTDFRAQLSNIKAKKPDVIFVPGYYTEVGTMAKQARDDLGIKQPFLGPDGWDSPELLDIGGDALQGSYFSTHAAPDSPDPRIKQFVADFKKKYNATPNALSAVAYDAANLLFDAIKRAGGTDRAKIRQALASTKGFKGVTGDITMDANRNAVKPLVIVQIKGKDYKYVTTIKP